MQQFLATLKKNGSAPPAAGIRGSAAAGGGGGEGYMEGVGVARDVAGYSLAPAAVAARAEAAAQWLAAYKAGVAAWARQQQAATAAAAGGGAEEPPDECTICMNPLGVRNGPGLDGTITTACHHRFHRKCINDWLNTGNTSCPNCRAALNPPFVGTSGRRQYGAKRYRKRSSRKQGTRKQSKYYKKKTRTAKSRNI
jgi:hypothetical protein